MRNRKTDEHAPHTTENSKIQCVFAFEIYIYMKSEHEENRKKWTFSLKYFIGYFMIIIIIITTYCNCIVIIIIIILNIVIKMQSKCHNLRKITCQPSSFIWDGFVFARTSTSTYRINPYLSRWVWSLVGLYVEISQVLNSSAKWPLWKTLVATILRSRNVYSKNTEKLNFFIWIRN